MYAVEERATRGRCASRRARRKERKADWLAVGVRAVKLVDGFSSIAWVVVCDKGGSDGAVVAIEEHSAGCDGTNAGEELL